MGGGKILHLLVVILIAAAIVAIGSEEISKRFVVHGGREQSPPTRSLVQDLYGEVTPSPKRAQSSAPRAASTAQPTEPPPARDHLGHADKRELEKLLEGIAK